MDAGGLRWLLAEVWCWRVGSSSAGGGRSSECGKLWLLFYKEVDFLQSKGRGRPEMAGRLESVIEEAEAALTRGLEQVQAWAVGPDAAAIYTCMGDLARYKARLGGEEQQVEACWKAAERWVSDRAGVASKRSYQSA